MGSLDNDVDRRGASEATDDAIPAAEAQRPVIPGFHPDPSVCRVNDTYYLVTSSFEYAPGVPLFQSSDLRSWTLIGNVLNRHSQLDVSATTPSGGVFAPTLRHHDGRFWMITTNWSDNGGQLLVSSADGEGLWSDATRIPDATGIDPDLAWDEDGTCYMTYAGFDVNGTQGIVQSVIDPESGRRLTDSHLVWTGTGMHFPEGPHLYRVGDLWYLMIAEGGTERGHCITIARSSTPSGPFESCPDNPLLTHRSTGLPVQNTGHGDLVQRRNGSWAIVFHGVRVRGGSPQWHVLGRETFAREVVWRDGWPILDRDIAPGTPADVAVTERLAGPDLPRSWVAAHGFLADVAAPEAGGWRLRADSAADGVFVGRRQEHLYVRARAALAVDGVGGLTVRIDPHHALTVEQADGVVRAVVNLGPVRHVLGQASVTEEHELELRIVPAPGVMFSPQTGPDVVRAVVTVDGEDNVLGQIDGRYLSTEVAGGMTGRMLGVSCLRGSVLIRSFEYAGADVAATVFPGDPPSVPFEQPVVWG